MHPYSNEFYNDLHLLFDEINQTNKNSILAANQIIIIINKKIKELHRWLKKHIFASIDDEIYFFKYVKPKLISQLIYYTKIVDIESNSPTSKKLKIKYLEKELRANFPVLEKKQTFQPIFSLRFQALRSSILYQNKRKTIKLLRMSYYQL